MLTAVQNIFLPSRVVPVRDQQFLITALLVYLILQGLFLVVVFQTVKYVISYLLAFMWTLFKATLHMAFRSFGHSMLAIASTYYFKFGSSRARLVYLTYLAITVHRIREAYTATVLSSWASWDVLDLFADLVGGFLLFSVCRLTLWYPEVIERSVEEIHGDEFALRILRR